MNITLTIRPVKKVKIRFRRLRLFLGFQLFAFLSLFQPEDAEEFIDDSNLGSQINSWLDPTKTNTIEIPKAVRQL